MVLRGLFGFVCAAAAAACVICSAVSAGLTPPEMPLPNIGLSILLNDNDSAFEVECPDDDLDELREVVEMRSESELCCCADEPLLVAIARSGGEAT